MIVGINLETMADALNNDNIWTWMRISQNTDLISQQTKWCRISSDRLSLQFLPFINQHFLDRFWQWFVLGLWQSQTQESPCEAERPEYEELEAAGGLSQHHHERCEDGTDPGDGADYPQGGVPNAGGEYLAGEDVESFEGSGNAELCCNE